MALSESADTAADTKYPIQPYFSTGGPMQYVVAQNVVFVMKHREPNPRSIVKRKRISGHAIYTTGKTWTGPMGAVWAQVDGELSPDEVCWVLVEGSGFGVVGPALISAHSSGKVEIAVKWADYGEIFHCVMPRDATVKDLVLMFCDQTGLCRKETIFTKALPGKSPNDGRPLPPDYTAAKDVLNNEMKIGECHLTGTINLIYLGNFEDDYKGH